MSTLTSLFFFQRFRDRKKEIFMCVHTFFRKIQYRKVFNELGSFLKALDINSFKTMTKLNHHIFQLSSATFQNKTIKILVAQFNDLMKLFYLFKNFYGSFFETTKVKIGNKFIYFNPVPRYLLPLWHTLTIYYEHKITLKL